MKLTNFVGCAILGFSSLGFASENLGDLNLLLGKHQHSAAPHQHVQADGKNCYRKPGAEIAISGREFVSVSPGEIKDFLIDLTAADAHGHLQVQLDAGKGLQLLSDQHVFNFDLAENQNVTLPVQLRAAHSGNWILNIVATITNDQGMQSSRAMALVVQSGNVMNNAGQQKGQEVTAVSNEVVVLPASEVIR